MISPLRISTASVSGRKTSFGSAGPSSDSAVAMATPPPADLGAQTASDSRTPTRRLDLTA